MFIYRYMGRTGILEVQEQAQRWAVLAVYQHKFCSPDQHFASASSLKV